jgi:hypothetical protein
MSWDLTRANVRAFLRKEHHPITGFLVCFVFAFLLQLTTIGILIVLAGGVAGFLLKRAVKAVLITFAAGTSVWLTLFFTIFLLNPAAFLTAVNLLSALLPAPHLVVSLVGGLMTGIGGQLGVIVANFVYPRGAEEAELARAKPSAPIVPTEDLPRRRVIKRRRRRRK